MKSRATAGVTLMELLVVITLLSLLSVGMLFALRIGLNVMGKANDRLMSNRKVMSVEKIFDKQLAGIMPVKADCHATPDAPTTPVVFFEGDAETMRFVSSYSLQEASRGYPRILEYQVIPGAEGRGVRLVVNELLYSGPLSTGSLCTGVAPDPTTGISVGRYRPVEVGSFSFVLADKLASCRILYKEDLPAPVLERWVPRWVKARLPSAIRIEMAPLEPDSAKLQFVAFTGVIHVNRDIMIKYNE